MSFPPTTVIAPIYNSFVGSLDGNGYFEFPILTTANYLINASLSFPSSIGVLGIVGSTSNGVFYTGEFNATGFQCSQTLSAGDSLIIQILTLDETSAHFNTIKTTVSIFGG